jgi:phage antirepressor YoqD-like protein
MAEKGQGFSMTKLPRTIKKVLKEHRVGMSKVIRWLRKNGVAFDKYDARNTLECTAVDIGIRHDNDYIEMGPPSDDPKGEMFHVFSRQTIEFSVPFGNIPKLLKVIAEHQSIGKMRIAPNIRIHTNVGNKFAMQKHMLLGSLRSPNMEFQIEFRIYHKW